MRADILLWVMLGFFLGLALPSIIDIIWICILTIITYFRRDNNDKG